MYGFCYCSAWHRPSSGSPQSSIDCRIQRSPAPLVPVSAAAFLLTFVEQQIPAGAASDPASVARLGCHWTPVYHVKVGDNSRSAWRKRRGYGGSARSVYFPRYIPACCLRRCWDHADRIAAALGGNMRTRYIAPGYISSTWERCSFTDLRFILWTPQRHPLLLIRAERLMFKTVWFN